MIRAHFGLASDPFSAENITLLPHQQQVLDIVRVHCQQGGFCLIMGEPGTGKSVLKRALCEHDPKRMMTPVVDRTLHTYHSTLRILCEAFQIEAEGHDVRCERRLIAEARRLHAATTEPRAPEMASFFANRWISTATMWLFSASQLPRPPPRSGFVQQFREVVPGRVCSAERLSRSFVQRFLAKPMPIARAMASTSAIPGPVAYGSIPITRRPRCKLGAKNTPATKPTSVPQPNRQARSSKFRFRFARTASPGSSSREQLQPGPRAVLEPGTLTLQSRVGTPRAVILVQLLGEKTKASIYQHQLHVTQPLVQGGAFGCDQQPVLIEYLPRLCRLHLLKCQRRAVSRKAQHD